MSLDLRRIAWLVLFIAVVLVAYRSLEDDVLVRETADAEACLGVVCEAELTKSERTLFGWSFEYETYGSATHVVVVECTREMWLFGDYDCHVASENTRAGDRFD